MVISLPTLEPERAISKSQLEAVTRCERLFGFQYLEKVEGERNRFADLGTNVHAELESWMKNGKLPDMHSQAGQVAEPALAILPPRHIEGLMVEAEVFTITQQAWYHGFGDLIEPPFEGALPRINDYKSTTDFKWAMTKEGLARDYQANIYVRAAMQLFDTDEAEARWIYLRTRAKPKVHLVSRRFKRAEVETVFDELIDPLAAKVQVFWDQRPKALDLEPNPQACSDYGGCKYRGVCNLSARSLMKSRFAHLKKEEEMGSFADKMKAKIATTDKVETPAPDKPKASDVNPPEVKSVRTSAQPEAEKEPPEVKKTTPATPATPAKAPTPKLADGFILLVNCRPSSMDMAIDAHLHWIPGARELVQTEAEVLDWRMVDFGKGPGMLCAAVRQMIKDEPPKGFVILDATTDEGRACFDAFRDHALWVIRGL